MCPWVKGNIFSSKKAVFARTFLVLWMSSEVLLIEKIRKLLQKTIHVNNHIIIRIIVYPLLKRHQHLKYVGDNNCLFLKDFFIIEIMCDH